MRRNSNLGKSFERLIEQANQYYELRGLASVDKNPVEWRYTSASQYRRLAHLAPKMTAKTASGLYLVQTASDVDYSGSVKMEDGIGRSIYFDAKETKEASFPYSNLREHQLKTLINRAKAGAIAGIMLRFDRYDRVFFIEAGVLDEKIATMLYKKGRKSLSLPEAIESGREVHKGKLLVVDWLELFR